MIEDLCLKAGLKKDLRLERRAMKLATDGMTIDISYRFGRF